MIVLMITALSLMFLLPLICVQLGNFCLNRSTNERFSRQAIQQAGSVVSGHSASMVSGMTMTTSLIAEQVVTDVGKPIKHRGLMAPVRNCGSMLSDGFKAECCGSTVGHQEEIYRVLEESRAERYFGMEDELAIDSTSIT